MKKVNTVWFQTLDKTFWLPTAVLKQIPPNTKPISMHLCNDYRQLLSLALGNFSSHCTDPIWFWSTSMVIQTTSWTCRHSWYKHTLMKSHEWILVSFLKEDVCWCRTKRVKQTKWQNAVKHLKYTWRTKINPEVLQSKLNIESECSKAKNFKDR